MRLRSLLALGVALGLVGAPILAAEGAAGASELRTTLVASPTWGWPLRGQPVVDRPFQPPASAWGAGHRGVDLEGELGEPVLAAGSGIVTYAGLLAGRGVVTVTHADGLRTTYEPVAAQVHVGEVVAVGEVLGALGTGHASCRLGVACLHWGLLRGRTYLDPLGLVVSGVLQLLPIDAKSPAPREDDDDKDKKKDKKKRKVKEKARKLLDRAQGLAKKTGRGVAKAGRAVGRVAQKSGRVVVRVAQRAGPTVARAVARSAASGVAAVAAPEVIAVVAVVVVVGAVVYYVRHRA